MEKRNRNRKTTDDKKTKHTSKLTRVGKILKQKIKATQDYGLISRSDEKRKFPSIPVSHTEIYELEYLKALQLKEQLIQEFEGRTLAEVIPGEIISNGYGESYRINEECFTQFKIPDFQRSKQVIISDLKLVYGIGPIREVALKQRGYHTIEELRRHPRWKKSSKEVLEMIENNDVKLLQNWLGRFLPKSHPLVHYLAGFLQEDDFMLLDIETLGLFGRAIILLGIARPRMNGACINQYLLRDISEEPATLWEFASNLKENAAFITFNGRTFDVPSIQERLNFYGMEASLTHPHFDLLHFARRAWRNELPDCRLETIEKSLGIYRNLNIPSALVPAFYETYMETGNVGPLVAIVEHNKQDLLTLATMFSKLYEVWDV